MKSHECSVKKEQDFSWALRLIKQGKFLKRKCIKNDTVIVWYKKRLYQMSLFTGVRYPFVPTNADLAATDYVEHKN